MLNNRLVNLDYLRGVAAFSIMIYHYVILTSQIDSDSFLSKIGIYGVSIFYVLSGLTLNHVYENSMIDRRSIKAFFIKRFFRIFPLLWLVTLSVILINPSRYDFWRIFLNFSGLFSVVGWDQYIATGSWSIGNEIFFYLTFPLYILLYNKNKLFFTLLALVTVLVYLYFAFFYLSPKDTLESQWSAYINPLNQIGLFAGGIVLGKVSKKLNISPTIGLVILFSAVILFVFYPGSGERISLVWGPNRVFYSLLCFLICLVAYKSSFNLPEFLSNPLRDLGEYSYSLYLLHPLVWEVSSRVRILLDRFGYQIDDVVVIIGSIVVSLISSKLIYTYFEKRFVRIGAKYAH